MIVKQKHGINPVGLEPISYEILGREARLAAAEKRIGIIPACVVRDACDKVFIEGEEVVFDPRFVGGMQIGFQLFEPRQHRAVQDHAGAQEERDEDRQQSGRGFGRDRHQAPRMG